MAALLAGQDLIVASRNPGKLAEIRALLAPHKLRARAAAELDLPSPAETGTSFAENARLKARAAADAAGLPALGDDSGLVVPALGGAPGIHSARWAGPDKSFDAAIARLERALDGQSGAAAHFACALALCWPDGHCRTFEGKIHGRLTFPPRGARGFGYDPIFVPDGHDVTFAEMAPTLKDRISHRAVAFRKLVAACLAPADDDPS